VNCVGHQGQEWIMHILVMHLQVRLLSVWKSTGNKRQDWAHPDCGNLAIKNRKWPKHNVNVMSCNKLKIESMNWGPTCNLLNCPVWFQHPLLTGFIVNPGYPNLRVSKILLRMILIAYLWINPCPSRLITPGKKQF